MWPSSSVHLVVPGTRIISNAAPYRKRDSPMCRTISSITTLLFGVRTAAGGALPTRPGRGHAIVTMPPPPPPLPMGYHRRVAALASNRATPVG